MCVLFVFENYKNAEYFVQKVGKGNYEKKLHLLAERGNVDTYIYIFYQIDVCII